MYLSALGTDAAQCWQELPQHDPHITLDAFVVMPKHAHGIFVIQGDDSDIVGAGLRPAPTAPVEPKRQALPESVRTFKTFSARRISPQRNAPSESVGQPGYYEHVARSERNLADSRAYIGSNPARWTVDDYFLADR